MQPTSFSDSDPPQLPPNPTSSRSSTTIPSASSTAKTLLGLGPPSPPQSGNVTEIANDPFDYEQKYAPDEEFKEMSPNARAFRVYVDESAKYDREMVNGWREGLDMLLVFAALFSAVVTTFVTQNCQALRVDNSEVANSLMSEMIGVQRAILDALVYKPDTVEVVPSASTSFHRKSSDLWVNGLWFTSLGLSLSTTLLAILAKQWIHQYLSVHAGSPRNHCRVRHLRYTALHKWHVPLIIELLPVLMHAALGLFFVGLIIYLSSLSAAMALAMAVIATSAFGMYFICSVLPMFHPDCAYKTPLSIHAYSLYSVVRHRVAVLLKHRVSEASPHPTSLPDIELELVVRQGHILDASALGWLFNVTSNLSVQSIMLQAFSSLPLKSIGIIAKGGPEGIASVPKAIKDHFHFDQSAGRFERLQRAALRFANQDPDISVSAVCKEPSSYSAYWDSSSAIQLISASLTDAPRTRVRFDAVYWGGYFLLRCCMGHTGLK
ncbi:hypothetical protein BDZ89DRAFT_1168404 [Hymenopellis radicata]|nr:hypothetical protein BDZ89DRAFT_1168404 [Hymenopellis radicata]